MEKNTEVNDDTLNIEDDQESLNPDEETEANEDEESDNGEEENISKAEFEKVKKLAENYKIRAEKAEKAKKNKAPVEKEGALSNKDMLAILRENVSDDDIPEIQTYAKIKGITVADALKTSVVRTMLKESEEERKTAEVSAVGNKRPSPKALSGSELLREAERTGKLPESEEELQELAKAQFEK